MLNLIKATLQATHSPPIIDLALSSNDPRIKPLAFPHLAPMRLLQTFLDLPPEENFQIYTSRGTTKEGGLTRVDFESKSFASRNDLHLKDESLAHLERTAYKRGTVFVKLRPPTLNLTTIHPISITTIKVSGVFAPIHETGSYVREAVVLNP